ncbi:DUF6105 family protein [Rhizobiaceae bacterium BDR2-2]|uniref:DUF6105 family protein n=1 Tax=Ectorhizobium quercum TaxID=2965071 RepID=A0AAE3SXV2_9HYPH|nr:DUF6105 family protein [Ectorhizobium quercum]MCX8998890.1 DUF6105 family protein [Ectorhizobium quercum]
MKWFLFLWAGPVALLLGWYFLSLNDMSFGIFMLTRQAHDLVFQIYGNMLGIDPALLPPMVLRAIAVDSLLVLALLAFRRRKRIAAWWRERQASSASERAALSIEDNLSSAP